MPTLQLKPSPIELLAQDVLSVQVDANLVEDKAFGESRLSVDREISAVKNESRAYALLLRVHVEASDPTKPPAYTGYIELSGYYRVHKDYQYDPERLVSITGASMLYGVAREMITMITARSPNGILSLPSVSFLEDAPKKKLTKKAAKKTAKKKS